MQAGPETCVVTSVSQNASDTRHGRSSLYSTSARWPVWHLDPSRIRKASRWPGEYSMKAPDEWKLLLDRMTPFLGF